MTCFGIRYGSTRANSGRHTDCITHQIIKPQIHSPILIVCMNNCRRISNWSTQIKRQMQFFGGSVIISTSPPAPTSSGNSTHSFPLCTVWQFEDWQIHLYWSWNVFPFAVWNVKIKLFKWKQSYTWAPY